MVTTPRSKAVLSGKRTENIVFRGFRGRPPELRLTLGSEAIEDLTGGVTTELMSSSVLDKEKFWQELMSVNDEFLFGCWTGTYSDWLLPLKGEYREQKGIVQNHAYSIMDAKEIDGVRLLRLRYA
jgi:calpain family cysteine protease